MAQKKDIYEFVVQVELTDVENKYPNYRWNFCNRKSFISSIKTNICNILSSNYGGKIAIKPFTTKKVQ